MFYLLDDIMRFENNEYLNNYTKEELNGKVEFHSRLPENLNSCEEIIKYFNNLHHKIFFIHSSFLVNFDKKREPFTNIIYNSIVNLNKKYLIEFSGGTSSNVIDYNHAKVEVKAFYSNLNFFVDLYLNSGKIILESLIWGKEYRIIPIIKIYEKINERFFLNPLEPLDIDRLVQFIENQLENFYELSDDKSKFIQWIKNKKNMNKNEVLQAIQNWVFKYI